MQDGATVSGISGAVALPFRRLFATHLLEAGRYICSIQELFWHSNVKTAILYTYVLNRGGLGVQNHRDRM
jgi:DNA integrase